MGGGWGEVAQGRRLWGGGRSAKAREAGGGAGAFAWAAHRKTKAETAGALRPCSVNCRSANGGARVATVPAAHAAARLLRGGTRQSCACFTPMDTTHHQHVDECDNQKNEILHRCALVVPAAAALPSPLLYPKSQPPQSCLLNAITKWQADAPAHHPIRPRVP